MWPAYERNRSQGTCVCVVVSDLCQKLLIDYYISFAKVRARALIFSANKSSWFYTSITRNMCCVRSKHLCTEV